LGIKKIWFADSDHTCVAAAPGQDGYLARFQSPVALFAVSPDHPLCTSILPPKQTKDKFIASPPAMKIPWLANRGFDTR
jgi:hypothetical protein